jgi:HD superfamily phosphohydrolase
VSARRTYEFRCPIYGFITLSDWERDIIAQPAFQRLRRIRQLAWTDYVYPGAMHTRFEHSLGVMHMATLLYDGIVARSRELLERDLRYDTAGFERFRALIRIASLLHDVGHSPFSHAGEEVFPPKVGADDAERFSHEDYSAAIVRRHFADVIENHQANNYGFTADYVASLLEGSDEAKGALFWRPLLIGQMDADRMDYLLRDSHHAGVSYGRYDWQRLVQTVEVVPSVIEGGPRLGVAEGGWHAAEGLILARYFMFTQVYFHKTRIAYDHHLQGALKEMLPDGHFQPPTGDDLDAYLLWDDWRVLGLLKEEGGGEDGARILSRNHYREVVHTPEVPSANDLDQLVRWRDALGDLVAAVIPAEKSWYKVGPTDIPIRTDSPNREVKPLSTFSSVARSVEPIRQVRMYVRPEDREEAKRRLGEARRDKNG